MTRKFKLLSTLVILSLLTGCSKSTTEPTENNAKIETTEKSKSNDLVLREYEDDTMTISDNTAVDLKKLKSDTSIQKLVLYNCTTKDKTDITDKDDFFCDILPGTYKVYAYYDNDEMVNVTNQVECSTYFEAGSSDITE